MSKRGGSSALAAMLKQRTESGLLVLPEEPAPISNIPPPPPPPSSNTTFEVKPAVQSISDVQSPPKAPAAAVLQSSIPPPTLPAPTTQYLPKTTSFGGANKCCICEKTVYKMEETIAVGRVWHNSCFTCGGANNDGCKRTLTRDGYVDHDSQPYCNACYNKSFRTKGFGIGTGLNTDFGGHSSSSHSITSEPAAPVSPVHAGPPAAFQKPSPPVVKTTTPATPPPAPAPAPKYTPTNHVAVTSSTPKCTACAKSVYKVEEMIAVGRVWHALCFTCGGTKNEGGCGKVLKRDGYVDHNNQPYCNACHSKLFKPKGFGYGGTLSTDYGPTAEHTHTDEVTAGVGKLSTAENSTPVAPALPKPAAPAPPAPAAPVHVAPPAATPVSAPVTAPVAPGNIPLSNETNEKFKQAAILKSSVPNKASTITIGKSTAAVKGDSLHTEQGYVGDNDEVDESEW